MQVTSSSRSQRAMWPTTALTPSDLPRSVRGRPLASAGVCGGCYSVSYSPAKGTMAVSIVVQASGRASLLPYHCCTKLTSNKSSVRPSGSGGKGGVGPGGSGAGTGGTGEGAGSGPGGVGVGAGGTGSGGIGAGGVGSGTGGVVMARSLPSVASSTPHIWLRLYVFFAVSRPVIRLTAPEAVGLSWR